MSVTENSNAAPETTIEAVVPPAAPVESVLPAVPSMSPAECARELKARFPALFGDIPKPIKLRIQADIQARAPGVFTKKILAIVLSRHTGSNAYLVALSKSKDRFDLDGQAAGELSDEHRQLAAEELKRRRALHEERRAQENEQRALEEQQWHNRQHLLHDFEITTLTRANFCALKGVDDDELDGLLERARAEKAEWQARRPVQEEVRRNERGPRHDEQRRPHRANPRDAQARKPR